MIPNFYCTPGTISAATAILMEETGFVHEQVRVDFATAAQTGAEYLAVNPKGRVPALATGEGVPDREPARCSNTSRRTRRRPDSCPPSPGPRRACARRPTTWLRPCM